MIGLHGVGDALVGQGQTYSAEPEAIWEFYQFIGKVQAFPLSFLCLQCLLEAALIGMPDESGITRSKAFVVLKAGHAATPALEAELKAFVKGELAPHKYPRSIEFIAELPKTATGKIQRFRLREREAVSASPPRA